MGSRNYNLTPLSKEQLNGFFDDTAIKVITYFLRKSVLSQPEKLSHQIIDLPIQIPKEHIEQWIVQALGAKPIGAGSYPVDVLTENWAADVKMLSCKIDELGNLTNADSGETSLAQKFGDGNFGDGNTLDDLFLRKEYDFIWGKWQEILKNKYLKVENETGINDIYYFLVLRAGNIFYLCGLKVDLINLNQTTVNKLRSTSDSIWIDGFIEDTFGHVKIYKAKKRFELRLKPKKWVENDLVIPFKTDFEAITSNIREHISNNTLDDYIENVIIKSLKQ
jgi:hypothetical protein